SEIGNMRILESARLPETPIQPRKVLNISVAILAGCFLGIAFVFVLEYLNDRIRTPDDVERDIGLPVIAVIPKNKKDLDAIFSPDKNGRLGTTSFYDSIFFDAYNLLSFALDKNQDDAKTVLVTSATPNEGKSSISSMLAIASAQRGKRTLLIDADLRKPSLDAYFRVPRQPGLTNLVIEIMQMQKSQRPVGRNGHQALPPPINHNAHDNQLVQHQMIQAALVEGLVQTFEKNLLLLPCGFIPSNPVRVWSSAIWSTIFHHLNRLVDLIIIDAPPIIGVAETTMMAVHVENILFCIATEGVDKKTLTRSFKMFTESVPNAEKKIVGAVLNKADMVDTFGGFKYYYRYHSKKENTRRTPEAPRVDFRPPAIGVKKRIS
ncbi:hypothetical protein MJD09_03180, partial [bacterium]|nr:hypothetical protein [bacterium]